VIEKHELFGTIFSVENIPQLNHKVVEKSGLQELLWVCEGVHEKQFGQLADRICSFVDEETGKLTKRIVCIAGPSSSGKTTSAKRLMNHLRINGIRSIYMGMDDFYKAAEDVPIDPATGQRNYDVLSSLHIDLLVDRVNALVRGEAVPTRRYSFRGHRGDDDHKQMIQPSESGNDVIIVEGIHGLNPSFTGALGGPSAVHKVFVSALTQLNIDNQHHFSTSDNRLLRRMLRDYRTRGYSAEDTLCRWAVVRRNEDTNLFPYQEEADVVLNTALAYELAVLSTYCKPLLAEVRTNDPEMEAEVARLLLLCDMFYAMGGLENYIPANSILREFLGGSVYSD
jgi:uridine kinase